MAVNGAPGLRADLPLLKEAVDDLDRIAKELEAEVPKWLKENIDQVVHDPGGDPVSLRLGENMRIMAERAGVWLAEYAAQVRAAHAALAAQLESYRRVEDEITRGMRA